MLCRFVLFVNELCSIPSIPLPVSSHRPVRRISAFVFPACPDIPAGISDLSSRFFLMYLDNTTIRLLRQSSFFYSPQKRHVSRHPPPAAVYGPAAGMVLPAAKRSPSALHPPIVRYRYPDPLPIPGQSEEAYTHQALCFTDGQSPTKAAQW